MGEHRKVRDAKLDDFTDTALAMAMLWVIPVVTFVFMLARM